MMDQGESVGVRAGVGKGSGVGEDAGVEASGHRGRDLDPCGDGDVSDQQGEHFYADTKGGNVFDSDIWIMGTDHDFYNTAWTPPTPGASDDWTAGGQSALDPECGESATGTSRLSPADEAHTGAAYVAGFYELTLQDQTQFAPMFDPSIRGRDADLKGNGIPGCEAVQFVNLFNGKGHGHRRHIAGNGVMLNAHRLFAGINFPGAPYGCIQQRFATLAKRGFMRNFYYFLYFQRVNRTTNLSDTVNLQTRKKKREVT